jgi:hypothetical protein
MEKQPFQFFVVFHKELFDECYSQIPQDALDKYFTFIAVRPDIEKTYTPNKYKIINEWELPVYNPMFQERGYNENSAMYHVFANNLHSPYDYVGFFQYDMNFRNNIVATVERYRTSAPSVFYHQAFDFRFALGGMDPDVLSKILKSWETFHGRPFRRNTEFILWNTFVSPSEVFARIMNWVTTLYDLLDSDFTKRDIGSAYERVMAIALSQERLQPYLLSIFHDHDGCKSKCY